MSNALCPSLRVIHFRVNPNKVKCLFGILKSPCFTKFCCCGSVRCRIAVPSGVCHLRKTRRSEEPTGCSAAWRETGCYLPNVNGTVRLRGTSPQRWCHHNGFGLFGLYHSRAKLASIVQGTRTSPQVQIWLITNSNHPFFSRIFPWKPSS